MKWCAISNERAIHPNSFDDESITGEGNLMCLFTKNSDASGWGK